MSQAPQSNAEKAFDIGSPHREADDKEEVYFDGSPMVRGSFGRFLLMLFLGLAIIAAPFLIAQFGNMAVHWIAYLVCILVGLGVILAPIIIARAIRYRITNYRIDYERGILGKKIDTLELWHVDDVRFEQSFFDRLLGVGTVIVFSNDGTTPKLPMRGLPNPRPLFDKIKQRIIAVKRQRGVVKMDMGGSAHAE